jgi:hypothetical protein
METKNMANDSGFGNAPVRSWILRALINAVQLSLLGVLAGVLLPLAFAWLGMVSLPGQPGASPEAAAGFLNNIYSTGFGRVMGIAFFAGLLGFVAGISSTPTLGTHRKESDQYKIPWMGALANAFLLGFFGPLGGISYIEGVIVLGLFIGVPATIALSSVFYTKAEKGFNESGQCHSIFYWVTHGKDEKTTTSQLMNTTPGIPEKVVKESKQVESQEGEPEPTGKTTTQKETESLGDINKKVISFRSAQKLSTNHRDWITCSNCGNKQYSTNMKCTHCGSIFDK